MQQINLYQQRFHPKREPLDGEILLLAVLFLILVLVVMTVIQRGRLSDVENEVARLQSEQLQYAQQVQELNVRFPAPEKDPDLEDEADSLKKSSKRIKKVIRSLEKHIDRRSGGFSELMQGLGMSTIPGVWITTMGFYEGGKEIVLEGGTTQADRIPLFVESLSSHATFSGKPFRHLDMEEVADEKGVITFHLHTMSGYDED
ncbi:MAG: hypothetical protein HQL50_10485 [Magnetococcales bacterium]|nr:hypothetical protein [Magnetococcales bacterium]